MLIARPQPPVDLLNSEIPQFVPCSELPQWVDELFLTETSKLYNPDQEHLKSANLGFLWTNVENVRQQRRVVGMCELPKPHPALGKWAKARWSYQLAQWFGDETPLDFLITLSAHYAADCDDINFCSLVEHEMYHGGQKLDEFEMPMFSKKTGQPLYALRGHDGEEFTGIIRRYGVEAAAGGVMDLIAAAQYKPEIGAARARRACGNCLRLV